MAGKSNNGFILKHKNIWEMKHKWLIAILSLSVLIFGGLTATVVINTKNIRILEFAGIVLVMLVVLIHYIVSDCKDVKNYNYLVDKGSLLVGRISKVTANGAGGIQVEVTYTNPGDGKQYIYKEVSYRNYDFYSMTIFAKESPEIRILADISNMENGVVLLEEYCARQDWDGLYDKEPAFKSWRGPYKGHSSTKEWHEQEDTIPNAVMIQGKLLKNSIQTKSNTRDTIIIYADVSYFDAQKGEVMIFSGEYTGRVMVYWEIKKSKEDIFVQVAYNPEDKNDYVVYLSEALEQLG